MRICAATFALLTLSTCAFAADSPADREGHRAARMERLATLLDLDDYQKTQVQAILDEQHQKREALHDTAQTSTREQREALRKETLEKLRPVLTEAQLKKLEALRDERHDPGHRHCVSDQT
jgi:Spy/CpxP family protein refolding chaperone